MKLALTGLNSRTLKNRKVVSTSRKIRNDPSTNAPNILRTVKRKKIATTSKPLSLSGFLIPTKEIGLYSQ
jgi:hypothetical protein